MNYDSSPKGSPSSRQPMITSEFENLESTIKDLIEVTSRLMDRTNPIVRHEPTAVQCEEAKKEVDTPCEVAHRIRVIRSEVVNVISRINYQISIMEI